MAATNSGKDSEKQSFIHCLQESYFSFSYKIERAVATRLNNFTPGVKGERKESLFSHKNVYTDVHSRLTCKNPKPETIQNIFHQVNSLKKRKTHHDTPVHEILLSNKRNELWNPQQSG